MRSISFATSFKFKMLDFAMNAKATDLPLSINHLPTAKTVDVFPNDRSSLFGSASSSRIKTSLFVPDHRMAVSNCNNCSCFVIIKIPHLLISNHSCNYQGAITDVAVREICRRLPCLQQPALCLDVAGVAFDCTAIPSVQDMDPFVQLCCGSASGVGMDDSEKTVETFDIPFPSSINEISLDASSNASYIRPLRHSRVSAAAIMLFIIEALTLVLFDIQLLPFQAVAPRFMYFWVAQVVVASISLIFFTCCLCVHHWHNAIEAFVIGVCICTNSFIIICAAMVIASYTFTDFQIYVVRMTFLASRSFNCVACIISAKKQILRCISACTRTDRLEREKDVLPKSSRSPVSTGSRVSKREPASHAGASFSVGRYILQPHFSMFKQVTNRLALLESGQNRRDYVACRDDLMRICPPQNRLLVSLSNTWGTETAPEAFDMLAESCLGGHVVVDCTSDGCCGLLEFYDICALACKWLQSCDSNTVVIYHKGPRSCAAMLCCGILMSSGVSPECEHALHLVLLSSMLPAAHDVGQLTSCGQRCMVRFFDCFLHAGQHPICALPRFLAMIVLKGCVALPAGFEISVDVNCSGISRVKSGSMYRPSPGEYISREIDCKLSSAGTLSFTFERNSVLCRGDIEIVFLVKSTGNRASARIASIRSHTSFCGISEPHVLRYNALEVDWLGDKQIVPQFFAEVELHFGSMRTNASDEPAASIFSGQLVHFNRPAFNSNMFLSALLSRGSQLHVLTGSSITTEPQLPNNHSPSIIVILDGACSVELVCPSVLNAAACVLPGAAAGQMLPSLQVIKRHARVHTS